MEPTVQQPNLQTPISPIQKPQKPNFLLLFVLFLLAVLFGGGGYYAIMMYQSQQVDKLVPPLPPEVTASPEPVIVETANWKTYSNADFKYSFNCPNDWEISEKNDVRGSVLHTVMCQETNSQGWSGSFEIRISDNPHGFDLNQFAQEYKQESATGANLIAEISDTSLAGFPAKKFRVFAFDRSLAQIIGIRNNLIYTIEFDDENPNDPEFTRHQLQYEQILSTFQFTQMSVELPSLYQKINWNTYKEEYEFRVDDPVTYKVDYISLPATYSVSEVYPSYPQADEVMDFSRYYSEWFSLHGWQNALLADGPNGFTSGYKKDGRHFQFGLHGRSAGFTFFVVHN